MADERKKIFIETVEALFDANELNVPDDAKSFFEDYKKGASAAKAFTEKGIAIIKEMREVNDWISAKSLGERMDISGRSYIEKQAGNPASYKITDKGMTCEFDNE